MKEKTPSIAEHLKWVFGIGGPGAQGDTTGILKAGTIDPNTKTISILDDYKMPSIEEMKEIFKQQWNDHIPCKVLYPKPVLMITAVPENETFEEYTARRAKVAETREKVSEDLAKTLLEKKKKDDAEKHWTDKLNKPWYGAIGSLYMLRI